MGDNKAPEAKDIADFCGKFPTKCIEINLIILDCFIFSILLIDLIFISWKDFSKNVLVVFIFIFIISIIILILIIILRYWRAKNVIKFEKKRNGKIIAVIAIALSFVINILFSIENFIFNDSLNKSKIPCEPKLSTINHYNYPHLYNSTILNKDIRRKLETCSNGESYNTKVKLLDQILMPVTIQTLQYFTMILFFLFITLYGRIKDGLDEPEKPKVFTVENVEQFSFNGENGNNANVVVYNNQNKEDEMDINNEGQNQNNRETITSELIDSQRNNLQ